MATIKDENYINVTGWMVTKLNLKGVKLLVYAIIYGFSQDGQSCFHGSLEYFQEWTNSTRPGVINAIKDLVNDGLIIKEQSSPNNRYKVNKLYIPSKESLHEEESTSKESLHNNIDNNYNTNKDNNIDDYIVSKENDNYVSDIISYLNKVCGTKYKSSTSGYKRLIKARFKDGAKLQDFFDVIDFKYNEWGKNPKKFQNGQMSNMYLRPSTLFGNKMEEYLQQAWLSQSSESNVVEVKSTERSTDRSNKSFS